MRLHWLVGLTGIVALGSVAHAQPGAAATDEPAWVPGPAGAPSPAPAASAAAADDLPPVAGPDPVLTPPGTAPLQSPGYPRAYPAPAPYGAAAQTTLSEGYRWQMIAVDGASLALMLTASQGGTPIGALGYVIGGPLIHAAHGEIGRSFGSLGLRVGAPLLGGLIGGALTSSSSHTGNCASQDTLCDGDTFDFDYLAGFFIGFALGGMVAIAADDLVLAAPHKVERPGFAWAPRVSVNHDRASVGLAGRF